MVINTEYNEGCLNDSTTHGQPRHRPGFVLRLGLGDRLLQRKRGLRSPHQLDRVILVVGVDVEGIQMLLRTFCMKNY